MLLAISSSGSSPGSGSSSRPGTTALWASGLAVIALLASGCHLDLTRIQRGTPLNIEAYEKLETSKSTLTEALQELGAPDRVEWKTGKDYIWYYHEDTTRLGIRFRIPDPAMNLGISYSPVEIDGSSETTNQIALVFDESHVLERKSLRLSDSYSRFAEEDPGWSIYLQPRGGVSPYFFGDGGEKNWDDLFSHGAYAGLELGLLPAPFFTLLIGVTYHTYPGEDFTTRGLEVSMDDLELYQAEIGGRLNFPFEFFTKFWDFEQVKSLFYSSDVRRYEGAVVFFKWTLGVNYNEEVRATIDGQDGGVYFDQTLALSTSIGGGFEYRWNAFGLFLEALWHTADPFEDNDGSTLDTDADGLSNILVGGGLSFRF